MQIDWVVGERNKGNCNDICDSYSPGSRCYEFELIDFDLQKAKEISISNGNQCVDFNSWNYGQGFSQCVSSDCCIQDNISCQYHCSVPEPNYQGCAMPDGFNRDHSRICPCWYVCNSLNGNE